MRIIIFFTALFLMLSCQNNNKNRECKEYSENLNYLKNYSKNKKDSTFYINEITKRINFLEEKTGLKAVNQGDWIGKHEVRKEDIKAWQDWINKYCR